MFKIVGGTSGIYTINDNGSIWGTLEDGTSIILMGSYDSRISAGDCGILQTELNRMREEKQRQEQQWQFSYTPEPRQSEPQSFFGDSKFRREYPDVARWMDEHLPTTDFSVPSREAPFSLSRGTDEHQIIETPETAALRKLREEIPGFGGPYYTPSTYAKGGSGGCCSFILASPVILTGLWLAYYFLG
jgi:hypothetical protein